MYSQFLLSSVLTARTLHLNHRIIYRKALCNSKVWHKPDLSLFKSYFDEVNLYSPRFYTSLITRYVVHKQYRVTIYRS